MHKIFSLKIKLLLIQVLMISASGTLMALEANADDRLVAQYLEKGLELKNKNFRKSFLYADSLEMIASSLGNKEYLFEAYKLKGDICHLTGSHEEGFRWLNNAMRLAREMQDTLRVVKVYNNLGGIYHDSGKPDKALENYTKAFLMGESYLNTTQKATVLANIALVYADLEHFKEAHEYYQKALKLADRNKNSQIFAYIHCSLGELYTRQNIVPKAQHHFKIAREYYEKLGDKAGLADNFIGFANLYMKEQPEVALDYLKLSRKIYENLNDRIGLFYIYKSAGEIYFHLRDYENAQINLEKAIGLSDSLKNAVLRGEVLLKLGEVSEKLQLPGKATHYYKDYIHQQEKKNQKDLVRNIANAKLDYEIGLKENKIKLLKEEAAEAYSVLRNRNIALSVMAGLAVLVVFLGAFYISKFRNLDKLNRALVARNRLIVTQKAEIQDQHNLIMKKQAELEKARNLSEGYFAELLDIKEQLEEKIKQRTTELEETYKRLSFHINNTPLAVLEWNNKMELINWPKQAEEIFGFAAEEVLGLSMTDVPFVSKENKRNTEAIISQLSAGEFPLQYFTTQNIGRFGNILFIEWSYSAQHDEAGKLVSVLTIANDVTLREKTYKELEAANQELDTFLYKSSHDLRGPLARMQGIITLGLMESSDTVAHQYFNMLKKVTNELNTILLRLMSVHSINQHEFKIEKLNFSDFITSVSKTIGSRNSFGNEVTIKNKVFPDFFLESDYSLISIILFNLLENGMRFADNLNPIIEVEAIYLPSGKNIITVADNGLGIPEEFKEKVFDMFFQGSTRSTGTGLGLFMVKKAVKKLGGEIKLYTANGFTVFEMELPAAKAARKPEVKVLN